MSGQEKKVDASLHIELVTVKVLIKLGGKVPWFLPGSSLKKCCQTKCGIHPHLHRYVRGEIKNKGDSFNKKTTIRASKVVYFSTFLNIFALDPNTLFAALVLPPEDGGELFFSDGVRYPFTHALEALLGQVKASQLFFHFLEQEEVRWCQVR